jgi:SdpI/YfhL protein family
MLRASDLIALVLVVNVVVLLNVPKLLLPALFLTLSLLSFYRWRRESKDPIAAERYRWQLVASCVLIAAISVPLIFKLVPPNGVYGFRTSLTRRSSDVWYQANAFMGWTLVVAAVVSGTVVTMLPRTAKRWLLLAAFLGPMLCAVAASFIYLHRLA